MKALGFPQGYKISKVDRTEPGHEPVPEFGDGRHRVADAREEGDEAEQLERLDVGDDRRDAVDQPLDVVHHAIGQQVGRLVRLEEAQLSKPEKRPRVQIPVRSFHKNFCGSNPGQELFLSWSNPALFTTETLQLP